MNIHPVLNPFLETSASDLTVTTFTGCISITIESYYCTKRKFNLNILQQEPQCSQLLVSVRTSHQTIARFIVASLSLLYIPSFNLKFKRTLNLIFNKHNLDDILKPFSTSYHYAMGILSSWE